MPDSSVYALIVAAGTGERFGGEKPKQYMELSGIPLLRRSVQAFLHHPKIKGVQVVINPSHSSLYDEAVKGLDGLLKPVEGGDTRQISVLRGLQALEAMHPSSVLIHDAARPLVSEALITRVIEALAGYSAVLPTLPVKETLKRVQENSVKETIDRAGIHAAQTPQGFHFDTILAAHLAAADWDATATDDAMIAEQAGITVFRVEGEERNLKVTTPEDFVHAEQLLPLETRVGMGFDVHRFKQSGVRVHNGEHVTLCGVKVPSDRQVEAHSDGDVGIHALVDALLGAIAAGDIGQHFPPTDPKWKDANSARFLKHAVELLHVRGAKILHADITIICELPKVSPHREDMRKQLASLMGIEPERVSVKATTTEKLGFLGRGEGLAAQAIVTVKLPGE